jgi:hypothetical protein
MWRNFVMLGLLVEKPVAVAGIPEIVSDVSARIKQSPKKPPRKLAQEIDLSNGTCHKILKQDLNLHSYKITVVQELLARDFATQIRYGQWFLNHLNF